MISGLVMASLGDDSIKLTIKRSHRGHHRICSKSYSKDSGMIPRLDVAVSVERPEPGLAGRLGGRHAP
jgi:hypothetical protein